MYAQLPSQQLRPHSISGASQQTAQWEVPCHAHGHTNAGSCVQVMKSSRRLARLLYALHLLLADPLSPLGLLQAPGTGSGAHAPAVCCSREAKPCLLSAHGHAAAASSPAFHAEASAPCLPSAACGCSLVPLDACQDVLLNTIKGEPQCHSGTGRPTLQSTIRAAA